MPPTTDEIEAAAGRLRRLAAGEDDPTVYAWAAHRSINFIGSLQNDDSRLLADAWLAANPADDSEPATACWVMAALPADADYPYRTHASHPGKLAALSWHCGQEYRPGPADRAVNFRVCVNGVEIDWRTATRGQLRRLLAALGVPAAG